MKFSCITGSCKGYFIPFLMIGYNFLYNDIIDFIAENVQILQFYFFWKTNRPISLILVIVFRLQRQLTLPAVLTKKAVVTLTRVEYG